MDKNEYKVEELQRFVELAVRDFLENDKDLLELKVHEQAITHRIAVYLEQVFNNPYLNFDCEYNKSLEKSKSFIYDEKVLCTCNSCGGRDKLDGEKRFRPDILVHKRNKRNYNLIAIEFKCDEYCKFDEKKIIALTHPGGEYKYTLGLYLYFKDNKPVYNWFIEGKNKINTKQSSC